MDGLQLAKRVRDEVLPNGKRPFIISMSAHTDAETLQRARGGDRLSLDKPLDPSDLERLLRRFQSVVVPSAEPSLA
jgi:CheY-like chemotaxis protein